MIFDLRFCFLSIILIFGVYSNVSAKECDLLLFELSKNSQLTKIKETQGKQTTHFKSGSSTIMSVSCTSDKPSVAIIWDGPNPDDAFYDLVGTAGNLLTQRTAAEVEKYSKQ